MLYLTDRLPRAKYESFGTDNFPRNASEGNFKVKEKPKVKRNASEGQIRTKARKGTRKKAVINLLVKKRED